MSEPTDTNGSNRRVTDDRLLHLERSHEALRSEVQGMRIQLTEAVSEVKGWRGNQEHILDDLRHLIRRLDLTVFGDSTMVNPGLVVNMDRLKNITDARTWHIRTLWASMVGVMAAWLSNVFGKHP